MYIKEILIVWNQNESICGKVYIFPYKNKWSHPLANISAFHPLICLVVSGLELVWTPPSPPCVTLDSAWSRQPTSSILWLRTHTCRYYNISLIQGKTIDDKFASITNDEWYIKGPLYQINLEQTVKNSIGNITKHFKLTKKITCLYNFWYQCNLQSNAKVKYFLWLRIYLIRFFKWSKVLNKFSFQGKIACANVLSDLYAMGVTECDNMLMLLAVSTKMTEKERDVVVPLIMRGFKVSLVWLILSII